MLEKILNALLALFRGSPLSSDEVWRELDTRGSERGEGLSPRTSIVDLLKTLNMESSLSARRTLWQDLGHTDPYHGSADQNIELHRAVMKKIAERGIKL